MKRLIVFAIYILALASCTKNFEETNTDPTTAVNVPTSSLLTKSILDVSGYEYATWRTNFIYTSLFVQQFASTAWQQGDKYFYDEGYSSALWSDYYPTTIKGLDNLILKTSGNPDEINYNSIARILRALAYQRLTDLYGDIPYSQASQGFTHAVLTPKYDTQDSIYNSLLNEVSQAAGALDASKPITGDITSYNNDISKWKEAAYSLMLRLGMRLSKVNPDVAKTWAATALQGGPIMATDDTWRVLHLEVPNDNPVSHVLGNYNTARGEIAANSFKFSEVFINTLKATNDPRLTIVSVVRDSAGNENGNAAAQIGMPNGTNPADLPSGGLQKFSTLRKDFTDQNDPNIQVSASQTLFLLAEAAERGWINGNGEDYFRKGVLSALEQLNFYAPPPALMNEQNFESFANGLTYGSSLEERLKSINTQYWIATLLDGEEAFANWRRSGYPQLTPVNYPGNYTGGQIPRRLQYPAAETGVNAANYNAAVSRQGPDNFNTRVWWDKP